MRVEWTTAELSLVCVTKGATLRSPNYIRKTKNTFYGTLVSVPLEKFREKLLPHAKLQ